VTDALILVFLYARVSTRDKGQDTENQLRQLREFAARQGWKIVREFIDHETGSTADRDQFKEMFLQCSQRKAAVVLFWSLDRFTREGALPTLQFLNTLTSYGVGYRSFTEQYIDSCGIFKDVVIAILATIAKQERVRIQERVLAGMASAKELLDKGLPTKKGKTRWAGRPPITADNVQIVTLRTRGYSLREIAKRVGVSEASVRRVLKSTASLRQKGVKKAV
jgi:DNA invertase Pin-like site-specific DNA recombinase